MKWPTLLSIPRPPDVIIGLDAPTLLRWFIIPRNDWFNVYLHKFVRPDNAFHDHPYGSMSFILSRSGYLEYFADQPTVPLVRKPWRPYFRRAVSAHSIALRSDGPVWTLFFTGRRVREWGFICPEGWVSWKEYIAAYVRRRRNELTDRN